MKKIKISIAVLSLVGAICLSLVTNATSTKQATPCSTQPFGQGDVGTTVSFGCGTPGAIICCYRIPDNHIIYKQ